MFKKFKPVLLSFFALVFAFWLGTGIAYEINPRWFLSDTATEIPENPNTFVAKLARLFRNADRAVVIVKESMRTEESLAGAVDDGPLQSEKDYLALAVRLSRLKEKAKWFHVTEQEHGEEVWLDYYIGEGGLVAVSLLQRSPEAFVNAEYLYRNDRPFSVNVYGCTAERLTGKIMKRQENIGLFGNRTVRYLMRRGAGKSGKMFMSIASGVIRWPRYIWRNTGMSRMMSRRFGTSAKRATGLHRTRAILCFIRICGN